MQKGAIRVQTENIFPIIKKFLYSEHDIFIRELVSNAVDATQKLKTLSSIGEAKGDLGELRIDVTVDAANKTIVISDRGVGMTADEVDKYLNQVAFSGAEEFLQKYKGQNENNIIGHFGLGFYASFMVSETVEVITKSFKEGAEAVRWVCDGSPEYTLEPTEKEHRGTDIILHINDESKEFLEPQKVKTVLEKFCKFLPVAIYFHDAKEPVATAVETAEVDGDTAEAKEAAAPIVALPINNTHPAWTKKPSELTKEDYENFYKELYPYSETPLFWIHLNVDYPFNLTGILYFPKIKQSYEIQKDKIQLYSNQVFVTDEVKDIVPEFLMLLHGVIDSPDIPLNVSRSYLQGDPNVRKINSHITKKVADKLEEMYLKDRTGFQEKWEHIGLFVKYGMMTEDKFLEKAAKFNLFEEIGAEPKFYTLEEYKMAAETLQKNKDGKLVILYATNPIQQDSYIQAAKAKGYIVVKMETIVDAAFINNMEMKWNDVTFTRVDADIAENLIDKQDAAASILNKEQEDTLKGLFDVKMDQLHVTVEVKGLSPESAPIIATRPEFMRRMKDMAAVNGQMGGFYASMPDEVTLTVNGNHPIYQQILNNQVAEHNTKMVRNLADLALLSQGLLKGNDLTHFINRSVELMGK